MTQVKAGGGGGDRNSAEILVLCLEGVQTQHLAPSLDPCGLGASHTPRRLDGRSLPPQQSVL